MSVQNGTVLSITRELRLKAYDWNGSGGLPLRSDVADPIAEFYGNLPGIFGLPSPDVLMNPDGTIEVSYSQGEMAKELLLTFKCQGVITYVQVWEDRQTSVEGTVRFDPMEDNSDGELAPLPDLLFWISEE